MEKVSQQRLQVWAGEESPLVVVSYTTEKCSKATAATNGVVRITLKGKMHLIICLST